MEENCSELWDAVIVGAGPAGSTLARTLARNNLRALLIEKETPGNRRVCGGFAGPEISDFFSSAGLSDGFTALPKKEILGVRITGARSGAADTSFAGKSGWAVDRGTFDAWLAQEAVLSGAHLSNHSTAAYSKKESGIWKIAVLQDKKIRRVKSRFFIVASGRRAVRPAVSRKIFFACKTAYKNVRTPAARVTLHFVDKGHVGLNPLGEDKTAMCLYVESSHLKTSGGDLDKMMERLKHINPHLAEDMRGAERIADWQACAAEPDHKRVFYENGIFYAGDALTMVNPVIGGGLSVAAVSAQLLGNLIALGISKQFPDDRIAGEYEKMWTARFGARLKLAASLGMIERSKVLSDAMLFLLGAAPAVFSRLVRSTRKDPSLLPAQHPAL